MPDKKISQLTGASTPVAGTEVLPIVQSGSTKSVSIDNLTKGRTVSALSFDTDVAAAGVTLSGTTLAADGTDANISINVTPKGTGVLKTTEFNAEKQGGVSTLTDPTNYGSSPGVSPTGLNTKLVFRGDLASGFGSATNIGEMAYLRLAYQNPAVSNSDVQGRGRLFVGTSAGGGGFSPAADKFYFDYNGDFAVMAGDLNVSKATSANINLTATGGQTSKLTSDSSGLTVNSVTSAPVIFKTNDTDRGRFDANGNHLIGTASAASWALQTINGQTAATNTKRYYTASKTVQTGATTDVFSISLPGANSFVLLDYEITCNNGSPYGSGSCTSGKIAISRGLYSANAGATVTQDGISTVVGPGSITSFQVSATTAPSGNTVTFSVTISTYVSPNHSQGFTVHLWSRAADLTVADV